MESETIKPAPIKPAPVPIKSTKLKLEPTLIKIPKAAQGTVKQFIIISERDPIPVPVDQREIVVDNVKDNVIVKCVDQNNYCIIEQECICEKQN